MTITHPSAATATGGQRRALTICATFIEDLNVEFTYPDNWAAPGRYQVFVPSYMDDATAAVCAMGGFHLTVPIKHLYMFEFTVIDEPRHCELEPDHDLDWYELAQQCEDVLCRCKEYEGKPD